MRMMVLAVWGSAAVCAQAALSGGGVSGNPYLIGSYAENPAIDGTTVVKVSFANGFSAEATEGLRAEYEGVKAQVLTWDEAGNWAVER